MPSATKKVKLSTLRVKPRTLRIIKRKGKSNRKGKTLRSNSKSNSKGKRKYVHHHRPKTIVITKNVKCKGTTKRKGTMKRMSTGTTKRMGKGTPKRKASSSSQRRRRNKTKELKMIEFPIYDSETDLNGKDMRNLILRGALMSDIVLEKTKFQNTKFIECAFKNVDFGNCYMNKYTEFISCIFTNCKTDRIQYTAGAKKMFFEDVFKGVADYNI